MVVLSKQQKIITGSIAILLDHNVEKEEFQKKKENPRDFGCINCLKKGKALDFSMR